MSDVVTIALQPSTEKSLRELAAEQGEDAAVMATRIVEDFIAFQTMPETNDESWAEASVALAPELMRPEHWHDDSANGSR